MWFERGTEWGLGLRGHQRGTNECKALSSQEPMFWCFTPAEAVWLPIGLPRKSAVWAPVQASLQFHLTVFFLILIFLIMGRHEAGLGVHMWGAGAFGVLTRMDDLEWSSWWLWATQSRNWALVLCQSNAYSWSLCHLCSPRLGFVKFIIITLIPHKVTAFTGQFYMLLVTGPLLLPPLPQTPGSFLLISSLFLTPLSPFIAGVF